MSFELRAPKRAPWIASTLGPVKPTLSILVANRRQSDARPVDISRLQVHLEAIREGISFRCAESVGASAGAREPSSIAAGGSIVIERALDCALPLTGRYSVRVAVSFGPEASRRTVPLRTFTLNVTAPPDVEPRPILGIRGVWAAIGGSRLMVGESGAGSGRIALLIVNGSARAIALPPLKLALRVYRVGSPIPCVDEPIQLKVPRTLASGAFHREPIDVSCLGLGSPGRYEVVAQLIVAAGEAQQPGTTAIIDDAYEVGRLGIEVSNDPSRRMSPMP